MHEVDVRRGVKHEAAARLQDAVYLGKHSIRLKPRQMLQDVAEEDLVKALISEWNRGRVGLCELRAPVTRFVGQPDRIARIVDPEAARLSLGASEENFATPATDLEHPLASDGADPLDESLFDVG